MKKTIYAAVFAIVAIGATDTFAQRVELKSGDIAVLSGQKTVNVEYDYSEFGVGKFATEKEYLDKKSAEYNAKEAGKGDAWKKAWVDDRKNRFEPKFEELFNKGMADKGLQAVQSRPDATYTLIVRTKFVEPGFNVGVMRKNAYVDYEVDLVESANKSAKVAQLNMRNVPGGQFGGFDFDTGVRIAESYAKAGKSLAAFLDKKL
ncbi:MULTISPECIES: hypothetical protein [Dyadobacter]|uniref:Uncharacterized protein n=1 Tax=Dyadobacter chenhuakuii TaxID=2909339 RepID=A0A9X1U2F3_9BACT|nr:MULTISPECIES: hypothetical protein [Dyadobacter]MCF2493986.1 hypothetical protein [Dyadobacter chenhuakuii]MCF2500501.1 hypothetical protein [Dyadobacter chenhuakuii]MCF2518231.1 hypothetical protein [Dyadobacter sp. CY351]USJ31117.1 hypothetical protein NFI80_25070 [Dyadobacter chenhuakuii]